MKFLVPLLFAASLAFPFSAAGQTINQWKDPRTGNTTYSDQPPPSGIQVTKTLGGNEQAGSPQQSYATQLAAEKFPILLYTSADCTDRCAKGRELLNGRGAPFTEKMVQADSAELAELKALSGGDAVVPLILVGKQKFVGFDAGSWNNLLDLAGYPKTASPGSKPSGTFAQ